MSHAAVKPRATRREFVAGAAGGALALAAGAGSAAADAVPSDSDVLAKVLAIERLVVLGYRQVLSSGTLGRGDAYVASILLGHELEHISALAKQLTARGASAATGPLDVKSGQALLSKHHVSASLTALHSQHDSFRLLVDLESLAEGAYFTALKTLGSLELVQLAAQAMACEAQHWTVISGLRNPGQYVKSVPWPFVTGSG